MMPEIEPFYPHGEGVPIGRLSCLRCDKHVDLGDEMEEALVRMAEFQARHQHGGDGEECR